MGRNATLPVLGVSNTTELAERFSRRARNLTASPLYRNVFGFGCSEDTKSAGSWENERGGEFFAAGIGSAIAGRRAKLGLIDDPIKSREEADSDRIRQKHWDWYLNDFLTRLMPGAAQIVIQCLTGDTSVLMADGSHRALRDIRAGDSVASFEADRLVASKVLNWANQGHDCVIEITTSSGRIVKANKRHPFLVARDGVQEWIRVQDLQVGNKIVCAEVRGSVDYSATTATSLLDTASPKQSCELPLTTYEIGLEEIVSIRFAGTECVYDIQVERTENFIANSLVSHNTRWHEDDLSGRILEREADKWTVIKLPMEAIENDPLGRKRGDRLWPEWFTQDMCDTAKKDVRAWNALYQQDPAPEDGEYFKRDYFQEYDLTPAGMHIYGASDYAVSEGDGDYTEHGIFGLDFTGCIYILDWWREQAPSNVWIEKQCDLINQYQPLIWFGESGPIKKSIEPFLKRRMQERGALCRLEWLSSVHDKVVRARPFQARAAMGNVFIPAHAPWKPELMSQLMRFPAGKYDDGVDVCSLMGRGLEHARPPEIPKPKKPSQPQTGHFRATGQSWMGS